MTPKPTHPAPTRPQTVRRLLFAALVLGAALPAAGCGSATPALPSCRPPGAVSLPGAAGSLTQSSAGAYCLGIGQTIDVFLTAPAGVASSARWSQITISDTAVLGYGNAGAFTPPVSVTPGVLVGVSEGTAIVTSTLPGGRTWTVTIVVRPNS